MTDLDLRVVADASKDALAHTTNDTSTISHTLVYTELNVLLAEEESLPAEHVGGGFGADSGARATLAEEERDRLEKERL